MDNNNNNNESNSSSRTRVKDDDTTTTAAAAAAAANQQPTHPQNAEEQEVSRVLMELQQRTKRFQERGEHLLHQAKQRSTQNEGMAKRYASTRQKLQIIFAEIQKQLGVIKRLIISLRHKSGSLLQGIETTIDQALRLLRQLQQILDQLKTKRVHKEFATSSPSASMSASSGTSSVSGSLVSKRTLYDFVNVGSVTELQQQADSKLAELRDVETLAKRILEQVDEQYDEVVSGSQALLQNMQEVNGGSASAVPAIVGTLPSTTTTSSSSSTVTAVGQTPPSPVSSPTPSNDAEIRSMSNIVLNIASLDSKIQHILRNPVLASAVDLEELKQTVSQLPQQLDELDKLLEQINTNCANIETKHRRFSDFYRSAVHTYECLERMAPSIPNKVVQIDELQTRFHNCRINSSMIFEEIKDLTLWYTFFQSSYENLLLEIQRRHQEHERQQMVVDQFRKTLSDMYDEEEKKRQLFFEEFGRYLPASLCPSIMDRTTRFDIVPTQIVSKLPQISLTEEEQQQLDLHRYQQHGASEMDESQQQQQQSEHTTATSPDTPMTPIQRGSPPHEYHETHG